MLKYNATTENLRIFNRNSLKSIDNLTILINKLTFECNVIELSPKYIYFTIENIGLIQPSMSRYEYILTADETIIDKGNIIIN